MTVMSMMVGGPKAPSLWTSQNLASYDKDNQPLAFYFTMPIIQNPSETERDIYYYGLVGSPKLIARSSVRSQPSTDEWTPPVNKIDGAYPRKKQLFPCLPSEPIVPLWDTVIDTVEKSLQGKFITIDLFRIGYTDELSPNHPATVLISVEYNIVKFPEACECIWACLELLFISNIDNVDIEVKEAIYEPRTTSYKPLAASHIRDEKSSLPFTSSLGQSLSTSHRISSRGTMGLYLREPESDTYYGLTCAHVVFPDCGPENRFTWKLSDPKIKVYQPGPDDYRETLNELKAAVKGWENEVETLKKDLEDLRLFETRPERLARLTAILQHDEAELNTARERRNSYIALQNLEDRCVGHVIYTSSYSTMHEQSLQDWALIELDRAKYEDGEPPLNEVYLGAPLPPEMIGYIQRGPIELNGTCPLSESPSDGAPMIVGKRGRTTGLTWGNVNGVFSAVRARPGVNIISREIAVLGRGGGAFSEGGDSGAIVFCRKGHIFGLLNGGTPGASHELQFDVTYVTPIKRCQGSIGLEFRNLEIA